MARRLVVWGVVLTAAALLAFLLQGTIQDVCIVPVVGQLRMAGLFLRSVPQSVFWSLLVISVALIALGNLFRVGRLPPWHRAKKEPAAVAGPIGELAQYLHNTRRGLYFKWLIAHRLGELAQAIDAGPMAGLSVDPAHSIPRGTPKAGEPGSKGDERSGNQAIADIQAYMEAGLDRPPVGHQRRRLFSRRPPTPLDLDPSRVVEYLESQMETKA